MLGYVLDVIFTLVVIRAIWKLLSGISIGMSVNTAEPRRSREAGVPAQGVHMVKDPVCGTYVVPDRAVSAIISRQTVYFCSTECRDKYQAKPA